MSNSRAAWLLALILVMLPGASSAADEEGCLLCHRLPLRRHPSAGRSELRVQDPAGGVHASLLCSDCHTDAKVAPHPGAPGPATCLGECHGGTPDRVASHRRASFGGLTEIHRKVSAPAAPCLLCHRGDDRQGDPVAAAVRCGACHRGEAVTAERGIHGRIPGARETGLCPQCHRPHAPAGTPGVARSACDGPGCHAEVTDAMRRLAGHGRNGGARGRGLGQIVAFCAIASGGWLLGRFLGADRGDGDAR